jgi:hypothetical protein
LIAVVPAAAGITVMDKVDLAEKESSTAGVQTLCIDGKQFALAYGMAKVRGVAAAGGLSFIQVYEERGGKVVPAKCR